MSIPAHIEPGSPDTMRFDAIFDDGLALPESLVSALNKMNIHTPTPIQASTLLPALKGQDIMATAQTGTGKTLAYTLPLLAYLMKYSDKKALILTPTRELATQVRDTVRQLLGNKPIVNMALLIGGESMGKQFAQLKGSPRVIIGTPGRICDHLNRGNLSLKQTGFLVIDEADRMLDMGFSVQLDKIAPFLSPNRQTLMFSATLPGNIHKLAQNYLNDPMRISVDSPTKAAPKIKQEIRRVSSSEKFPILLEELQEREGSSIIFVKTKRGADQLADKLRRQDLNAGSLHGDLKQRQRDRVTLQFRNNKIQIMVATDIAARGLDIPHIRHVINYDLPQCPEDYIHRIGRTARAGLEGEALCLISPDDSGKWKAIQRLLNPGEPQAPANQGRSRSHKPFRKDFSENSSRERKGEGRYQRTSLGKPSRFSDNPEKSQKDKPFGKKTSKESYGHKLTSEGFGRDQKERPFGKKDFSKKPFAKKSGNDSFYDQKSASERKPRFSEGSERKSSEEFPKRDFSKKPFGKKPSNAPFQARGFKNKENGSSFKGRSKVGNAKKPQY